MRSRAPTFHVPDAGLSGASTAGNGELTKSAGAKCGGADEARARRDWDRDANPGRGVFRVKLIHPDFVVEQVAYRHGRLAWVQHVDGDVRLAWRGECQVTDADRVRRLVVAERPVVVAVDAVEGVRWVGVTGGQPRTAGGRGTSPPGDRVVQRVGVDLVEAQHLRDHRVRRFVGSGHDELSGKVESVRSDRSDLPLRARECSGTGELLGDGESGRERDADPDVCRVLGAEVRDPNCVRHRVSGFVASGGETDIVTFRSAPVLRWSHGSPKPSWSASA